MDFSSSPYYGTAIAAANAYGIPSSLFTAQIGQESSFNPNAQNGNATGIAQFMPGTAASLGVDPTDPISSLYGAAKYDAQLYSQYGSWQTALQKYGTTAGGNAPNVNALAEQADAGASWLNSIPFIGSPLANLVNTSNPVKSTTQELGSLLDIVTNVPRVISIVVGLILLIAGLFMLGARPAVQIVEKTKALAGTA